MKKIKGYLSQVLFKEWLPEFAAAYFLLFIIYALLIPHDEIWIDRKSWQDWTCYIFSNGLSKIYHADTNYMPGTHYILWLFGKMEGSLENINTRIYLLKLFILPFDFLAGFYLVKMIKEKFQRSEDVFIYSLFFFLNIFYLYNTLFWGQVDAVFTAFIFISVYYALKENVLLSIISALISLNFKLQAIVFVPLIGLLLIPLFIKQFSVKNILTWIIIPSLIQLLIVLPFLLNGDMHLVINVITQGSVGKCPVVSLNADNIWYWIKRGELGGMSDTQLFLGVSYKYWGLTLFFISSLFVLLPLLFNVLRKEKPSTEKVLLMASLLPLIFFFFNTQMHERYSHPAIIFIAVWSIRSRKFLPYILVSAAYFLDLEGIFQYLNLKNYNVLVFNPRFISGLYFIVIAILYFELYKESFSKRSNVDEMTGHSVTKTLI